MDRAMATTWTHINFVYSYSEQRLEKTWVLPAELKLEIGGLVHIDASTRAPCIRAILCPTQKCRVL